MLTAAQVRAIENGDLRAIMKVMNSLLDTMDAPRVRVSRTSEEIAAEQKAAKQAAEQAAREEADAELRMEIIEEMVAAGVARHVAANLTNTTAKMLEQGRKYGVL